ncbi:hypothetical protein BC940DRAFT_321766 [Gongronella butleri]|nr:hypothetical protein BC940DRAFT_321766 [Gongronella butleri]
MMIKSLVAIAAFTASALAQTTILSVTSPLQGASYTAGGDLVISWINPTVDTISQITLAQGSSTALQPVSVIATNVSASSGTYTWNIPAGQAAGTDYALTFGTSPNLSYSGQFSIKAGSGGSSSSGSAGSSGSASASGSSTGSPSSASSGAASSSSSTSAGAKLAPAALAVAAIGGAALSLL